MVDIVFIIKVVENSFICLFDSQLEDERGNLFADLLLLIILFDLEKNYNGSLSQLPFILFRKDLFEIQVLSFLLINIIKPFQFFFHLITFMTL